MPPVLVTLAICPQLWAGGGADVAGRFVVVGQVGPAPAVIVERDPFCRQCKPVDESVLVGPGGGLSNAAVWVRTPRGKGLPLSALARRPPTEPAVLANRRCRFSPRITLLRVGQALVIRNVDPTAHNTKVAALRNDPVNSVIAAEGEIRVAFTRPERAPAAVSCSIHPFMRGFVLIRPDPFMAVSGEDGRFRIQGLPAGEHQLQLWHESGYVADAPTAAGVTDRRGRLRVRAVAGRVVELGEIRVAAASLRP